MKIILLLICFTIFSNISFSQISAIFSLEEIGEDIDCDIYFYQSGLYEVILREYATDDILYSIVLSYGNYTIKSGNIELTDKYNGQKMLFIHNDDFNITAKVFYPGMLNKKFVKSTFEIYDKPAYTKRKIMLLNQERHKHNLKEKVKNPLSYGIYKSAWGLGLNLQSNSKYTLEYKGIILSKGTWNREENELLIKDSILNHSFYILIGKNKLIGRFLPEEETISNFSQMLPTLVH